jgi:3-oxoacyl-[acyl-carrier protein] reductase
VAVGYHGNEAGAKQTVSLVEDAGGEAMAVRLDLADQASVEDAAHHVTAAFGGVDVLVNNAVAWSGFPEPGETFETAPVDRMRASLEANLLGHYIMTRAVVGSMRGQGWGRVVHISTGLVEDGLPGSSAYVTAKAGLHGLTRTMSPRAGVRGHPDQPRHGRIRRR